MLRRSDSRNFSRTLAALGLVAGPTLFLLSALVAPAFTVGPEEPNAYLDLVAGARGRHLLAAVLFFAGGLALVPGLMGTMRLLRERTVGLGQVAVALVTLGVLTVPGFYLLQVVELEMADPALERAQMASLFSRLEEGPGGTIFLAVFGLGTVIGVGLLALALWRRRVTAVWGPIALVVAVVLGFLPDNRLASAAEFAVLLVGTSAIARRIGALSDEQWGRWQPLTEGADPS